MVFEKSGGGIKNIDVNQSSYDPLAYPLMFPSGQLGWAPNSIPLTFKSNEKNKETIENDIFNEIINDQIDDQNALNLQEQITESQSHIETQNIDFESLDKETPAESLQIKKKMSFVSSMQYYAYYLCDRPGNYLLNFGRLFHQFLVNMYAKIELGRLNFFRFNQDKINGLKESQTFLLPLLAMQIGSK